MPISKPPSIPKNLENSMPPENQNYVVNFSDTSSEDADKPSTSTIGPNKPSAMMANVNDRKKNSVTPPSSSNTQVTLSSKLSKLSKAETISRVISLE